MFSKGYTGFLVVFLFPLQLFSQDITGIWKGEFYVDSTKKTYPFELSISEDKGKLSGYSRISFEEDGIQQTVFRDHTIKKDGDNYIIEDDNQISKASSVAQPKEVKKTMTLTLSVEDSAMTLRGSWRTNKTRHFLAAHGTANMQRKNDFQQTALFKKLDELKLAQGLSFNKPELQPDIILSRKPEVARVQIAADRNLVPRTNPPAAPRLAVNIPLPQKTLAAPVIPPAAKAPEPLIAKTTPARTVIPSAPATEKTALPQPAPPAAKAPEPLIAKTTLAKTVPSAPATLKTTLPRPATPAAVAPQPRPVPVQAMAPVSKNAAVAVNERLNSTVQSLYYKSDSLQLTLYDNGEVDGDTVSVLLDGKVIIAKQRLDVKPNVHTIYFDKQTPDSMMLVMYAENLGSIPPNTGLLVVHDGKALYEVRFSADLSSNAAIILRRKKVE